MTETGLVSTMSQNTQEGQVLASRIVNDFNQSLKMLSINLSGIPIEDLMGLNKGVQRPYIGLFKFDKPLEEVLTYVQNEDNIQYLTTKVNRQDNYFNTNPTTRQGVCALINNITTIPSVKVLYLVCYVPLLDKGHKKFSRMLKSGRNLTKFNNVPLIKRNLPEFKMPKELDFSFDDDIYNVLSGRDTKKEKAIAESVRDTLAEEVQRQVQEILRAKGLSV